MPATKPVPHRRVASTAGAVVSIVAVLGLGPIACAGHHHINQAPPHPIAVEINNNLTIPTELTIFVTQDGGGLRQMLGTVPGAKTKSFTFTPISWDMTSRDVAEVHGERPRDRCGQLERHPQSSRVLRRAGGYDEGGSSWGALGGTRG
jgi:hypothetical protein